MFVKVIIFNCIFTLVYLDLLSNNITLTRLFNIKYKNTEICIFHVLAVPIFYRCNHVSTIVAGAYQTPVSNPNASICAQGQHTSHEAFVLTECDVPTNPATWKQGVNVRNCFSRMVARFQFLKDIKNTQRVAF
jgi:hypothetical protein